MTHSLNSRSSVSRFRFSDRTWGDARDGKEKRGEKEKKKENRSARGKKSSATNAYFLPDRCAMSAIRIDVSNGKTRFLELDTPSTSIAQG